MTLRRMALVATGLAVGVGAALAALFAFADGESPVAAETTTTSTVAPPVWWESPAEIQLGPAVLVIQGLTVEDGDAVLSFAIHDLSPVPPGRLRDPDDLIDVLLQRLADEAAVAPELWTLITAEGEIPGTTSGPRARTARFPLPGGVLPELVALRLDRSWMRVPYSYPVALPSGAVVPLDQGYSVAISRVIEQTDSRIVQVDLVTPGGFATPADPGAPMLAVTGEGWSFTSGRTSTGLQLVHDATPLPDPIYLLARSAYWVPFDRPIEIGAEVLANG
jgi:hypothetical protein